MKNLKNIIKKNLTNTSLKIDNRHIKILSTTCFWVKENFSAIISYYGIKYYCYYDRILNDVIIEK
jgi:hypothetical protein